MTSSTSLPWLSGLILLPLIGAGTLMLFPPRAERGIRRWATLVALAELAL